MYTNAVVGPEGKVGYKLGGEGSYEYEDAEKVTIMQKTGALDKHDTVIFEGDAVKVSKRGLGIVKWEPKEYRFVVEYANSDEVGDFGDWPSKRSIEVVGNIYKDPDLLEKTGEE